ncbi:MAG: DUF1203 domain-containing protein [Rubrivivax sp.]|nr:DUF1203 domain-containing protein [Rubrivivax sp.]
MTFRITGLPPDPFRPLWGLPDDALVAHRARRVVCDSSPGFPDRIELREAEPGETVLLVNHLHQGAESPYRSAHAVYVLEGATARYDAVGVVPAVLRRRMLSLRGFDAAGMMVDADIVDGAEVEPLIERLLAQPAIAYVHAHYAKRGCYAARIERA